MQFDREANKERDWSVIIMWGSIFVSVTMVTGTMMWNLGKSLRIDSYLEEHGVETCVELSKPVGAEAAAAQDAAALTEECSEIVRARHDACLEDTSNLRDDLRERRRAYMTCVMEPSSARAALKGTSP